MVVIYLTLSWQKLFRNKSEELVDRIIGIYTPSVLLCVTLVISLRNSFINPIECWCPHHWTRNWETYAESVCWISETYFNLSKKIFGQVNKAEETKLKSNKSISSTFWVPFVLFTIAFSMKLPKYLWKTYSTFTDIDLINFLEELTNLSKNCRPTGIKYATGIMKYHWNKTTKQRFKFLSFIYLVFKTLNFLSLVFNLFFIQFIFGSPNPTLDVHLIYQLFYQVFHMDMPMFPKVVQCIVRRNDGEYPTAHAVHCVVSFNFLYEKIFLILRIWLILLIIASFLNLLLWIYRLFIPNVKKAMIERTCERLELSSNDSGLLYKNEKFLRFMESDKFLAMLFIANRIDIMFSLEILENLVNEDVEANSLL